MIRKTTPRVPLRHATVAKPVSHGFASGKGWWVKFTSTGTRLVRRYSVQWHKTGIGSYKGTATNSIDTARKAFAQYVKEASGVK